MYETEIIKYLLVECDGLHPFYISRIVALLDIEYLKEKGKKLTDFDYQKTQFGFYSNKIPEILNNLNVEKIESERGNYLKLKHQNEEIVLPDEVKKKINEILDRVCDLPDSEINRMIIESPHYDKL